MTSRSRQSVHPHGLFITFEGGEQSGKTTHIQLLATYHQQRGYPVAITREPGGATQIGTFLRQTLLFSTRLQAETEALLFAADRAEHVATVIQPALATGAIVLCDRYIDSSVAYQGAGQQLGPDWILRLNRWATKRLTPDATFFLFHRYRQDPNDQPTDHIEARSQEFFARVHHAYRDLTERYPRRIIQICTDDSVMLAQREIRPLTFNLVLRKRLRPTLPASSVQRDAAPAPRRAE